MSKKYSELFKAAMENIAAFPATLKKGLMYFDSTNNRPGIDDGTDVSQLMLEKHLPEARRDTKVQLTEDANVEVEGTLTSSKGGTGINDLTGQTGKALVVNATEDGYDLADAGGGGGLQSFWQKSLSADLTADGVIGDLAISGLTIGNKYRVTLNVAAKRLASGANELQELTFSAVPTYGLFQIEYDGQTTSDIPYDANASLVQSSLEALSNIGAGDVAVSGDFSTGFEIEFQNSLGLSDVPEITIPSNSLTSGETGGTNEQQQITFSSVPTAGNWDIVFDGQSTAALAFNANAATVESQLELLPNINGVTVTGDYVSGFNIEFDGSIVERRDVPQVTTGSTLTATTNAAPYEFNTNQSAASPGVSYGQTPTSTADTWTIGAPSLSMSSPITAWSSFPYHMQGNYTSTFQQTGGVGQTALTGSSFFQMVFRIPNSLSGQSVTVEVRSIARGYVGEINPLNGKPSTGFTGPARTGAFQTFSHTFTVSTWGALVWFDSFTFFGPGGQMVESIDYIRVLSTSGVTLFEATGVGGVAPTGGTGITATPSTLADGAGAISGPSVLFGAEVKHDGSTIGECKYLPSAQNTEDAEVSMSTEGFITATTTTLSVESSGLGAAERLEGGDTRIIVEEYDSSLTEN